MELTVGAALDGERVDRVLATLSGCTRAVAAAAVESGTVRIDGAVVTSRHRRVRAGEVLGLDPVSGRRAPERAPRAEEDIAFAVVYADESIIVVDKPAGLVVHPGAGNERGTLVAGLVARFPEIAQREVGDPTRPGLVHRLDKQTSGLLVVARTGAAHAALVADLGQREVTRVYRALVGGRVESGAGVIDAPIGRSARHRTRMAVSATGRDARTHYRVERRYRDGLTLVEVRLETGRTHQIRVHLAAIGHPLAGDHTYRGAPAVPGLSRTFLHAARLELTHPRTGTRLAFSSPLPSELAVVLAALVAEPQEGC